jgi:hypothetical protein
MTDDDLIHQAAAEGFDVVERTCGDAWVWGWVRGDEERWPCTSSVDKRSTGCATG